MQEEGENSQVLCITDTVLKSSQRILDWLFFHTCPRWKQFKTHFTELDKYRLQLKSSTRKQYEEDIIANYIYFIVNQMSLQLVQGPAVWFNYSPD